MDRKKIAAVIILLAVVGVGLALFFANQGTPATEPSPAPKATAQSATTAVTPVSNSSEASTQPRIRFTSNGFSPATLTVAVGTMISVTNDSNDTVNVESNPHPTHTDNPFLNIGNIEPGQSKTVTITKAGTLGYHNHLNPSMTGTIVAQ